MYRLLLRQFKKVLKKKVIEIEPDEIFLDSSNLPEFDKYQFEGRIEKPITKLTILKLGLMFIAIFAVAGWRVWSLQIVEGEAYSIQSEINRLRHVVLFSERGVIYDRNDNELVWNIPSENDEFSRREYIDEPGFSHILGYINYPQKDSSGFYFQEKLIGVDGIELEYENILAGSNGLKITETNALNFIESESTIRPTQNGDNIKLSIDGDVQTKLYKLIRETARNSKFDGGAGVIMDINTGEILAIASYPEYDSSVLTEGEKTELIADYVADKRKPFLNRVISGLYTPGSIIKPFIAIGALNEKVITPEKQILSTGSISLPNPFIPDTFSVFKDWKAHGLVDIRDALSVSSNVYFYEVAGGFEDQKGIGIKNIEKYVRLFGIGEPTKIDLSGESIGTVPNPKWKREYFGGDDWRIGDTYNTAIGQYGFQITPIQMARAIGAIANDGLIVQPKISLDVAPKSRQISISQEYFEIVKEGMRQAVTSGTAQGLQFSNFKIAAKTGTAQVGPENEYINSLVIGFFPYENPRYSFAFIMERAPAGTLIGSVFVARSLFEWMIENTPQYISTY